MKRVAALWLLLSCLPLCAAQAEPPNAPTVAFLTAAFLGDDATTRALLKQGVDVNAVDKGTGFTALMLAAQRNDLPLVKLLLNCGASIDSPNSDTGCDGTPLLLATYGWSNVTRVMNPATLKMPGKFPLSKADDKHWQHEVLRWRHGYYNIVRLLIERGADVNARAKDGGTPLLHAAYGCDTQTVQLLLKHGADVNPKAVESNGYEPVSPLLNAVASGYGLPDSAERVKLLLAWGADLNFKDKDGHTALSLAKQMHQKDVVKVLEAELARRKAAASAP